jgi:hypothetical protein
MSKLEFFLFTGVLTQNFNTMDLVKFLEQKSKTSHSNHNDYIEGDIMQNQEHTKKNEKPRFYGQNKLFFLAPCPSTLGQF